MTRANDRDPLVPPIIHPDDSPESALARVELMEYGDYQCPQCAKAHSLVKAILNQLGNRVQFVFRHFPCIDTHPLAHHAAEAAEAARSQGKFWEMHDRLFSQPQALDDASLLEHALALRLNVNRFLQEMAEDRHVQRVSEDINCGVNHNVQTTPTFFINQQRFEGNWEQSELMKAIVALI
jgi:protein-disulfide isomerase